MNYLNVQNPIRSLFRSLSSSSSRSTGSVPEERDVRIAVMGASAVGKTALIKQLMEERFIEKHIETIEDLYKYRYNLSEFDGVVDILDTSGSFEYHYFRLAAMKRYDSFVLVFAVDNEASFREAEIMRKQIKELRGHVPVVVVGNKCDVTYRFKSEFALSTIVRKWGCEYMECSARYSDVTQHMFGRLISLSQCDDVFLGNSDYKGGVQDGSIFVRARAIPQDGIVRWIKLA